MKYFCLTLVILLSGCSWFNSIGEHMPVIGGDANRCENWQCFTSSGQAASNAKKEQVQQLKQQQKKPVNQDVQDQPQASAPAPAAPAASSSPAEERKSSGWADENMEPVKPQ